jgi:hypothetical protein
MEAFGLILIIGGIIFLLFTWAKGMETVESMAQWLPFAGKILAGGFIVWIGVQIVG